MNDRKDLDLEDFRARLLARRSELERMVASGEAASAPVELDQTRVGRLSRADALQNQAMALATEERRKAELRRIEAALKRLSDDDYGYCVGCDTEIPAKRLELDPTTALCVACAERN